MSDEISKDRSPRHPKLSLEDALSTTRKLHEKAGRASISQETAATAIGYSGINGASLTAIATLSQYGLIDRVRGSVSVSPLAIRILHPKDDTQRVQALREAALTPPQCRELYSNYHDCVESVLAAHLIQSNFTPDAAKRFAAIQKANIAFAGLSQTEEEMPMEDVSSLTQSHVVESSSDSKPIELSAEFPKDSPRILAKYAVPIGKNEVEVVFRGFELELADFDALLDYVELFKRQFARSKQTLD